MILRLRCWALPALLALCGASCGPTPAPKPSRPDVVLVVWDTTRPDHLTPYGYDRDTTPELSRIARESLVFEEAYASAPWTVPSVASLFTGLFPHNHRVSLDPANPRLGLPATPTLAEVFRDAGYRTGLFTAQGIFLKREGFERGFDRVEPTPDRHLVDKALAFVKERSEEPFFLVLYWLDPHSPYEVGASGGPFCPPGSPPVNVGHERGLGGGSVYHADVNSGAVQLSPEQYDGLRCRYDGELRRNDEALTELRLGLDEMGRWDSSLFAFTSDHGEGFGEHATQRVWHDRPYDSILHVPLILRQKSILSPGRVSTTVRMLDLYQTLPALAGISVSHATNAESLTDVTGHRTVVGATHLAQGTRFYRTRRHKLIRHVENTLVEVYELATDPQEQTNLDFDAALVERLLAEEAGFLQRSRLEVDPPHPATKGELDRIEALGYVSP